MADLTAQYRRHPMVTPLYDGLEDVGDRLSRIENAMSAILERLGMAKLSSFSPEKTEASTAPNPPVPARLKQELYTYRPLNTSRDEIRLLLVDNDTQGDGNETINTELIHVSLNWKTGITSAPAAQKDVIPQYTAMSYTWGEPKFTGAILLNGHTFPVTPNVETALRYMRKTKPGRKSYWWIDQICINQKDIAERNQQVGLMRRIYKTASAVNVWLGEAADDSDLAMKLLTEIGTMVTRGPGQKEPQYELSSPEKRAEAWKAISAFFARPWWSRAWIRQEVTLNHYTTVHCGTSSCQFDALSRAASAFASLDDNYGFVTPSPASPRTSSPSDDGATHIRPPFYRQAQLIGDLRSKTHNGYQFAQLKTCLFLSRACQATDLRDKVFSILGLADPDIHQLTADYQLPLRQVLVGAARSVLPTVGGLDLLAACQNPGRAHGLPSWVPNLCDPWGAHPIDSEKIRSKLHASPDIQFLEEDDRGVLRVSGVHFEQVKSLCSGATVRDGDTAERLAAVYAAWKAHVSAAGTDGWSAERVQFARSLAGPDSADAFWSHVLCMGDGVAPQMVALLKHPDPSLVGNMLRRLPFNYDLLRAALLERDVMDTRMGTERFVYGMMRKYGVGRRLCITANGFVGMVPAATKVGDSVALFYGGNFPFILREDKGKGVGTGTEEGEMDQQRYVLVGEAFFPGMEPLIKKPENGYIEIV